MNFELMINSLPRFFDGVLTTIELMAISLSAGLALALPIALMRLSTSRWLSVPAYAYVFFFRGTPLLLQLFLVYYGLSQFEFIRDSFLWSFLRQAYWCAIITFAMHTAAYVAEIMRGAIQAVPKGYIEAARALGMSRVLAFRRIVAPTAIRYGFPAYGNEVILMLKASALASTITLLDLMGVARTVASRTYAVVEMYLLAGIFYLLLTYLLVQVFKLIEKRLSAHLDARG